MSGRPQAAEHVARPGRGHIAQPLLRRLSRRQRRQHHDPAQQGHGADRLLRLRQVDVPAVAQPDARAGPGRPRRGLGPASTARTSTRPTSTRSSCAARSAWSSRRRTRSRRCRSTTTSRPGCKLNSRKMQEARAWTAIVERSLRGAHLWDEVKDRLDKPGAGLSGGQQQRLCIARATAPSSRTSC